MALVIEQYGLVEYRQAYDRQLQLVDRLHKGKCSDPVCLLLEHPPVFTLGRNGSSRNVSVTEQFLKEKNIELIRIERGGEVTYHGPGQLVCYPVMNLRKCSLRVGDFIDRLEQVMLDVVREFDISAGRDSRNHGIWVGDSKLGSVGIAIRHGITYHGLALNVNPDLEPFSWVNPCGLTGVSMTSMEREAGEKIDMDAVKEKMISALGAVFESAEVVVRTPSLKKERSRGGKPRWLKQRLPVGAEYEKTRRLVSRCNLHTVCQEARCPNQFECFAKGTATFMIMGDSCTRNCRFCAVAHGGLQPLDTEEPARLAKAVSEMKLGYVVITSVTRDDLADGGSAHFGAVIEEINRVSPGVPVEVLIPDFEGDAEALETVCRCNPAVLNHNVETVAGLYAEVRPQAVYQRSLDLLTRVKQIDPAIKTKSGIMVGLGETEDDLYQTMRDIRATGCDLLTIGQYLQPTVDHLPVKTFYSPQEFERLKEAALEMGFAGVASGPHVRSSYKAGDLYKLACIQCSETGYSCREEQPEK